MRSRLLVVSLCAVLTLGCFSVTVRTEGTTKAGTAATWKSRQNFFLGGLVGEAHVDVNEACGNRKAVQMQTLRTFGNMFLTFITFAIYAPGEARVWCE